jgi:hypothetical protein
MAALTADRNTSRRDMNNYSFPVKGATKLFAGSLACIDATGFLTKGAVSTTLKAVGRCQATYDNTAGIDGAINAEVMPGCFRFANSSAGDQITLAAVGSQCFIVDDQTVALTNGTSTRSVAGIVRDVDATGVWVQVGI